MKLETLFFEQKDARALITLHRPGVLNAINGRMLDELEQTLNECDRRSDTRVILLKASGDEAFSSGIDVEYVKDMQPLESRNVGRRLHEVFYLCRTLSKVILVQVDGICIGAGLELALSCDLIIASDRSTFGLPNINVGIPAIVEAALLPRAVGLMNARELCYTGWNWSAEQAFERGLLNVVCPPGGLPEITEKWLQRLETRSPMALMTQKEIIHSWMTTDLEAAIDFSINTVSLNWRTKDQKEGMGAFLEKRDAEFSGE